MIEFTKSYKTGDGNVFATIEKAQKHELSVLFEPHPTLQATGLPSEPMNEWIAEIVLDNKDKIVDILTTTTTSKPKARKINGGRKPRKNEVTLSSLAAKTTVVEGEKIIGVQA